VPWLWCSPASMTWASQCRTCTQSCSDALFDAGDGGVGRQRLAAPVPVAVGEGCDQSATLCRTSRVLADTSSYWALLLLGPSW
jgi:hypothetical protein